MFYPMIEGITDQMNQWITDFINNGTVKFCLFTFNRQIDFLVQVLRQITNHAREAIEYLPNRNHSHLHDNRLQIGCHTIHLLNCLYQFRQALCRTDLFETSFIDDKFPDKIHQGIKLFNINADRLPAFKLVMHRHLFIFRFFIRYFFRSAGRFSRCCRFCRFILLKLLADIDRLYFDCLNFRNRQQIFFNFLFFPTGYKNDVKTVFKFFLFKLFYWRNCFDNVTNFLESIDNHIGPGRF